MTTTQMKTVQTALTLAASYFAGDIAVSEKIETAMSLLNDRFENAYEKIVCFTVNLQLIVIAETGFDLSKNSYVHDLEARGSDELVS